ncbi:MAG: hypothetical protein JWO59_728 [Chloroflexi bacterium]|nr:hypothetical protein [Chloroflexota bacterium]
MMFMLYLAGSHKNGGEMPSRTRANSAEILRVYAETKSERETSRRLGLHYNTVHQHLRLSQGKCRSCANPHKPGSSYCESCLQHLRDKEKADRSVRIRQGICTECDLPRDPLSRRYCAAHRIGHMEASAKHSATLPRATHGGIPTTKEQYRAFRYRYKQAGLNVWNRLDGACAVCGVKHEKRAVHVHHIDENPMNGAEENLTLLCQRCHRTLHGLLSMAAPLDFLKWCAHHYAKLRVE